MKSTPSRVSIRELERQGAILEIQDGNHGELHPKASDYVDDGIPFVMANSFVENAVDVQSTQKLPEQLAEKLRIGFAQDGDVLLTHKGTIGNTAIVSGASPYWMLTPQVTYYRVDGERLTNRYLMYAFQEPIFQRTMKSRADQATRPYIGILAQRDLEIMYRSPIEQKRIVEILAPYDDLIANNKRRIELLEQSARLLFKEWFVRLRYPGHEHDKIVDGVPEGWEKRCLNSVANVTMGQSPKSVFFNDTGVGLPFHQGVSDYGFRFVINQTYSTSVTKTAEAGDILVSVRAPVGRINVTRDKIVLGRGLAALRSKDDHQSFLFYALKDHFFAEDLIGTGAIFAATNKQELERQLLVWPAAPQVRQFEERASVMDEQIWRLTRSTESLVKARDLLLPRLMDGRLTV